MHVLITGAAGYVGRRLAKHLDPHHALRLGDVRPLDDPRWVRLDVTDPRQAQAAMRGIDAVIHLAVASGVEGEVEDDDVNQRRFDVNLRGTANVLEAARREGVRRFVHTSSSMVIWGYEPPEHVPADAPGRPVGTYALTKHLAEIACEHYARACELSTVILRIAKPIDPVDPQWQGRRVRPQWVPFPDLLEAYRLALAARDIGFEIVTIVGESSRRRWDISKAERVLGWRPTMRLEDLGFELGDEREPF
jgi:uronate dehydrogenase